MHYQCEDNDYVADTVEELREMGCTCPYPLKFTDERDRISESKDKRTESKKLYDFAKKKIKRLVISDSNRNEVYAVIQINDNIETINLDSTRAINWLTTVAMDLDIEKIPSVDLVKTVLKSIISQAQFHEGIIEKIHIRIAQIDDTIWYDLGREDRKVVVITPKGFGIGKLDLESPLFRTTQTLQEQMMPIAGNDQALDDLCRLLLINKKDIILFKAILLCYFIPNISSPMIIQDGSAGTFKTTTGGSIKRIVDPSGKTIEDNVSPMQKKDKDLNLQLSNRYLICFDNVSHVSQEQSDTLCRAITGNSIQNRKLYKDTEEVIQSIRRKIVLNGITPNTNYPDLQTRSLKIHRDTPDNIQRITEKEFNEKFEKLLPSVLGQIFIILSRCLSWYKSTKYDVKPKTRMADFEVWGETASQLLGYKKNEFTNRYYEKLKEDIIHSEDSYPIVTAIISLLENKTEYTNTVSQIFIELQSISASLGIDIKSQYARFPKGANKIRDALTQVKPILDANSILFEFMRYTKNDGLHTKGSSILKFTKKDAQKRLD